MVKYNALFLDYFFSDCGEENCGICVLYSADSQFGCWQTTFGNQFKCIDSPLEKQPIIEGLSKIEWDATEEIPCADEKSAQMAELVCLHPNMRLRFVRKVNGQERPDLDWKIGEAIQHAGLALLALSLEDSDNSNSWPKYMEYSFPGCCNGVSLLPFQKRKLTNLPLIKRIQLVFALIRKLFHRSVEEIKA